MYWMYYCGNRSAGAIILMILLFIYMLLMSMGFGIVETKSSTGTIIGKSLMIIYASLVSTGLGAAVSGIFYYIFNTIKTKVWHQFYSCINVKSDDPIFENVNKFMRDKGYVARD